MQTKLNNPAIDAQRLRRELDLSVAELLSVRRSVRFQLGEALVETATSPRIIIHLPGKLWRLVRMARRTKLFYQIAGAIECGLPDALPEHLHAQHIVDVKAARRLLALVTNYKARTTLKGLNCLQTHDPIVSAFIERANELAVYTRDGFTPLPKAQLTTYKPDKKKVLYALHAARPITINGYTIRSHEIINGLQENGFNVIPAIRANFAPATDQNDSPFFCVDSVKYYKLGNFTPKTSIGETIDDYANALEAACQNQKPALIHAASNWTTGLAGLVAARRLGVPFIYEVRGFWELTRASVEARYVTSLGFAAQKKLECSLARHADHIFTLSKPMKMELVDRGVKQSRISITPNGVKPLAHNVKIAPFSIRGTGPVIGFIGSITPYEGLEYLLRAVRKLIHNNIAVRVLLVGDGPALPGLRVLADDLGITASVTFAGKVEPDIAMSCYNLIDLAVFMRPTTLVTRIVEPLKPLEAMASGTAVLVSSVAPLRHLAGHGERAAIVDTLSVDGLYNALVPLISNKNLRNALGLSGKSWVEKERNWKVITAKMTHVYSSHLATPPS